MKLLLFIIIITFLFPLSADGAVNNSDLIINGGLEELTLQEGERYQFRVQDDLTRIPILKNLYFQSTNPPVATVGKRNGILRAHFPGKTTIIITAPDGDNATIEVTVKSDGNKKASPLIFVFLLVLASGFGMILFKNNGG